MTEPFRVEVSYETTGYDDSTLRAVATILGTTKEAGRNFRGAWVDGKENALESLIQALIKGIFTTSEAGRIRHEQERTALESEVQGLRIEIERTREEIAQTPIAVLQTGFKEVQIQRNALEAEVVAQRARLARFAAAVEILNQAIK